MNSKLAQFLDRFVVPLTGRRNRTLTRQVDELARSMREELDTFKSSLEVSPSLVDEFREWRDATPIPANPLVSVCVPTYNRARVLTERSLPSVLSQSYRHIEVIVVGDACTDDTEALVSRLADPRIRFTNLPRRGQYPEDPQLRWLVAGTAAVNEALEMTRGDFITHLDDDDEYLPERIDKLVNFAMQTHCDFVWHPFWQEDSADNWRLNEAASLSRGSVTTSAVFYRSWFRRIKWDINAYRLREPGDWNRMRKIRYIGADAKRLGEPLLRHYLERNDRNRTS